VQTKAESFFETTLNTAIGFVLSYVGGMIIYPMFGFNISHSQNLQIIMIFTVISILRGYVIRRYFNAKIRQAASSLANLTHLE
jgi:hypothetical protein